MAKKALTFPKQLYVSREGEGDEEYFNASETPYCDLNESKAVAVYKLDRIVRVVNKTEVEPME